MALFPRNEPEIIGLVEVVCGGLDGNPDFPHPPVSAREMRAGLAEYRAWRHEVLESQERLRQALARKNWVLARLREATKSNLRAAQAVAGKHPEKLAAIGWGPPRPRTKLQPPGQVLGLGVPAVGPDWLELAWRKPRDGGAVTVYEILRRPEVKGDWEHAGSSVTLGVKLVNQPRAVALEYAVRAMNRAGIGTESGVRRVVL